MLRNQWMGRKFSQQTEEKLRQKFGPQWMIENPPANFEILQRYAEEHRVKCAEYEYSVLNALRRLGLPVEHQVIYFNRYIADIALISANTIIELDGGYHETSVQKTKDAVRDSVFIKFGFDVHRWSVPMRENDFVLKTQSFAKAYRRHTKSYSLRPAKRPSIVEKIHINGLLQKALDLRKRNTFEGILK